MENKDSSRSFHIESAVREGAAKQRPNKAGVLELMEACLPRSGRSFMMSPTIRMNEMQEMITVTSYLGPLSGRDDKCVFHDFEGVSKPRSCYQKKRSLIILSYHEVVGTLYQELTLDT